MKSSTLIFVTFVIGVEIGSYLTPISTLSGHGAAALIINSVNESEVAQEHVSNVSIELMEEAVSLSILNGCTSHNCHVNATCTSSTIAINDAVAVEALVSSVARRSFQCICRNGFTGDRINYEVTTTDSKVHETAIQPSQGPVVNGNTEQVDINVSTTSSGVLSSNHTENENTNQESNVTILKIILPIALVICIWIGVAVTVAIMWKRNNRRISRNTSHTSKTSKNSTNTTSSTSTMEPSPAYDDGYGQSTIYEPTSLYMDTMEATEEQSYYSEIK
ncbi:uncharacterized protein LOC144420920 [Styela clava]